MTNNMLYHAVRYAKRGWPVFPLHTVTENGACTCLNSKCESKGKHPNGDLVPNGFKDATTDKAKIKAWWIQQPSANIGIATGNDLLVVDLDPRHGGTLETLRGVIGEVPDTAMVNTGGGGLHLFFQNGRPHLELPCSAGKLAPGIDIRGDGGYVVVPPSKHASGGQYVWVNEQQSLAPVPFTLVQQIVKKVTPTVSTATNDNVILEGSRNDTLFRYAAKFRAWGHTGDEIEAILQVMNGNRCDVPLDENEVHRIANSVERYPQGDVILSTSTEEEVMRPAPTQNSAHFRRASEFGIEKITWLWDKWIVVGKLSILQGDPGLGKSLITMALIAAVTKGKLLPGASHVPGGGVVLIAPEDGQADTINPRLKAAGADLDKVTVLSTIQEIDNATGKTYERPFSFPEDARILADAIDEVDAKLVVIDPIMAVLGKGVDAHKDQDVRRALGPSVCDANEKGCAVVIVMHLNKGNSSNSLYRSGGSIAFPGMARSVLYVTLDPDDEEGRVLVNIKTNLGKKAASLRYRIAEDQNRAPYVEWRGESNRTERELLSSPTVNNTSQEAQDIMTVLKNSPVPMSIGEIAEYTKQSHDATEKMLQRKAEQGLITKVSRGRYTSNTNSLHTTMPPSELPTQSKESKYIPVVTTNHTITNTDSMDASDVSALSITSALTDMSGTGVNQTDTPDTPSSLSGVNPKETSEMPVDNQVDYEEEVIGWI